MGWLVVLAFGAAACSPASDAKPDDAKGTEVDLDGLKAMTPASWKKEDPSNKLRWMQFRVPHAKDDKDDADLAISKGLGGGADSNVERWKGQFTPPEGKKIDDVAKTEEIKIGGLKATYLDVQGTYKYRDPTNIMGKTELRPDYRMLAVYYDGKDNTFTFKLVGPAKTVEEAKKGFDEWLKAFKEYKD
jgi:hypothetical protein